MNSNTDAVKTDRVRFYWCSCLFHIVFYVTISISFDEALAFVRRLYIIHWDRVTHICVNKQGHHWFRLLVVVWPAPSHYLNQCWNIVDWTIGNKFQWNFIRNDKLLFMKTHLQTSSGKWRPFRLGFNELNTKMSYHQVSQESWGL